MLSYLIKNRKIHFIYFWQTELKSVYLSYFLLFLFKSIFQLQSSMQFNIKLTFWNCFLICIQKHVFYENVVFCIRGNLNLKVYRLYEKTETYALHLFLFNIIESFSKASRLLWKCKFISLWIFYCVFQKYFLVYIFLQNSFAYLL